MPARLNLELAVTGPHVTNDTSPVCLEQLCFQMKPVGGYHIGNSVSPQVLEFANANAPLETKFHFAWWFEKECLFHLLPLISTIKCDLGTEPLSYWFLQ